MVRLTLNANVPADSCLFFIEAPLTFCLPIKIVNPILIGKQKVFFASTIIGHYYCGFIGSHGQSPLPLPTLRI
jgi:hypothetical protein